MRARRYKRGRGEEGQRGRRKSERRGKEGRRGGRKSEKGTFVQIRSVPKPDPPPFPLPPSPSRPSHKACREATLVFPAFIIHVARLAAARDGFPSHYERKAPQLNAIITSRWRRPPSNAVGFSGAVHIVGMWVRSYRIRTHGYTHLCLAECRRKCSEGM